MTPADLGATLKFLRWSDRSLAERLGCTRALVGQWRSGRSSIPPKVSAWLRTVERFHEKHPAPPPSEWKR